jgi:hypothetical protein
VNIYTYVSKHSRESRGTGREREREKEGDEREN